jgi:hypothetical protein
MPRKLRTPKERNELTRGEISHLIHGYDFFCDGFGRDVNEDVDARMRVAWEQNREQVEEQHRADTLRAHWPIYAALRFDEGLSHQAALNRRRNA